MNNGLIELGGGSSPFPFFGEAKKYKIYNDGENYVATLCARKPMRKPRDLPNLQPVKKLTEAQTNVIVHHYLHDKKKEVDEHGQRLDKRGVDKLVLWCDKSKNGVQSRGAKTSLDYLFESLYKQAVNAGLKDTKIEQPMTDFIKSGILELFPDYENLDEYVAEKIKRAFHNLGVRKKRFRRKAHLNNWNYFVTFTYDDKKHTEATFLKKLLKCFSNLKTRRGWRLMGCFERAPETGRLHFHGVAYVPAGEMIGTVKEVRDYSTAQHEMQTVNLNTYFADNFGRNDFKEISKTELQYTHGIDYILKYIGKTDGRIYYSRGIPTELYKELTETEIITEFTDFVTKFVLFDNVINWERDIARFTTCKQMTIIDLLCNPPQEN